MIILAFFLIKIMTHVNECVSVYGINLVTVVR